MRVVAIVITVVALASFLPRPAYITVRTGFVGGVCLMLLLGILDQIGLVTFRKEAFLPALWTICLFVDAVLLLFLRTARTDSGTAAPRA